MTLFFHDSIDIAVAESRRLGFPLVVLLHAKPDVAIPADSAGAATTADDLSFLPSAYVKDRYGITSSATAATTPAEASARLLSEIPAFWQLASAAPTSYRLNPNFALGGVRGGTAQRLALEATVLHSGLLDTAVFVRLAEGEEGFGQFVDATSGLFVAQSAGRTVPLPCACLFTPNNATRATTSLPAANGGGVRRMNEAPPQVLCLPLLTPKLLVDVTRRSLSFPTDPILRARQQQMAMVARSRTDSGSSMGQSAATGGQGFAFSWKQHFLSDIESVRQTGSTTSAASSGGARTGSGTSASADKAKSSSAAQALADTASTRQREMHLVHIVGLPFQRHKTVFVTSPSITLKTIWQDVAFTLQRLQKELERCQELDEWHSFGGEKAAATVNRAALMEEVAYWFEYASTRRITLGQRTFQLRVLPPADATSASAGGDLVGRLVRTEEEAQKVHLANLPVGARIEVMFTDEYASLRPPTQPTATTSTATTATAVPPPPPPSGVTTVCVGDVCRRVPTTTTTTATTATTTTSSEAAPPAPASSATATAGHVTITLRCSLPSGETLTFTALDPASATLAREVRPQVEATLGHSRFAFVRAYPSQRFRVDEDEVRPLAEIGLRTSQAVRVALEDDAPTANAATSEPGSHPLARLRQFLTGKGNGEAGTDKHHDAASASSPPQPSRTYYSMAEMLAAQDEEENARAAEQARMEALAREASQGGGPNAEPTTGVAAAPQDMQALLRRFAQQVNQQSSHAPTGTGSSDEQGSGSRPGKSQRFNGDEDANEVKPSGPGAGRRLGGGDKSA